MATAGEVEVIVRAVLEPYLRDMARARRAAQDFDRSASRGMMGVSRAQDTLNRSMQGSVGLFRRLIPLATSLATAFATNHVVRLADTWSDLNSRLKVFTGDADTAAKMLARIEVVANRTYSSLNLTAESFIRNATTLRDLGATTAQQMDFTEALNNAMVASSIKGERAAQVQNALSKAMATGALRGDGLNSIMGVGGRVAEVLAEHLGVTTLELRRLGAEGKITSTVLVEAFLKQFDRLRDQADSMPATVGDAFLRIGNAVLGYVGTVDQAFGVTESMARGIVDLSIDIRGAADETVAALRRISNGLSTALDKLNSLNTAAAGMKFTFADLGRAVKDSMNVVIGAFAGAFDFIKSLAAGSPSFSVDLKRDYLGELFTAPTPSARQAQEESLKALEDLAKSQNKLRNPPTEDQLRAAKAFAQLTKNARDTIKELELEAVTADKAGVSAAALSFKLGLLNSATDKGRSITAAQRAEIEKLGQAFEVAATKAAEAQLNFELGFDRRQMFRSDTEQTVASTLRGAGLPENLNSAAAAQIRYNAQLEQGLELAQGFASTFTSGLREGKSALDSLTDSLKRLADRLLDMALDATIRSLFGSLFGGGLGGGSSVPAGFTGNAFGLYHAGTANVGMGTPSRTKVVSPAIFARAPRLHDGLAPDEFPAILQRGEGVTPKGGGSRGGNQIVNIQPPAGFEAKQSRRSSGTDQILDVVFERVGKEFGLRQPALAR